MQLHENDLETIPVGSLGLITLKGCEALGAKINDYIVDWRNERETSTRQLSHSQVTREIITLLRPAFRVLVQERPRV